MSRRYSPRTCGGGATCTLDEGHDGYCVGQRPAKPAGGAEGGGRDLVSQAAWREGNRVEEPEVWEMGKWKDRS